MCLIMKFLIIIVLLSIRLLLVKYIFSLGLLYTERIPIRINNISPVCFPDCLHLVTQVIYGLEKLCQYFGYFRINPNCIGINCQNIVKVWHNPNFACMYPYQSAFSES